MSAVPQHFIHVYQRPAEGSSFLKRYVAFNYQHTIVNQGWFDTASCDIAIHSSSEGNDIISNYLGCFVAIYVDNPMQPIWEGLINRITFNSGTASYTISLDEMANRVSIVYTGAANAAAETALTNSTVSQAIYGIKQDQIEFGSDPSAGTQRTVLRDTLITQRAFPQTAFSQAQGQTNIVHFELIGIFHTLEWEKFFSALSAASNAANTVVAATVAALGNGTTFFDNTDASLILANAMTIPTQTRGISYWERIQKAAEAGDASNYWVAGVMPTDRNTGKRIFYYRQFNGGIEYTAFQKDGLKPRNIYGQPIPPWLIVPDRSIRVEDILIGFDSSIIADPRVTYIQNIQYDANSQKVEWFGTDNTTARAAFQLFRSFKPLSKNMPGSAPLRTIVT